MGSSDSATYKPSASDVILPRLIRVLQKLMIDYSGRAGYVLPTFAVGCVLCYVPTVTTHDLCFSTLFHLILTMFKTFLFKRI